MKYFIFLILSSEYVFAAGSGHGSPSDLVPAAVNVSILLAAIIFGMRGKLKSFFAEKSVGISEMLESASAKAKEAEMMMEMNKSDTTGVANRKEMMRADF